MKIICIFCVVIFFGSCSKNKLPDDVLPPQKMEAVFWDVIRADIYTTNQIKKDSAKIPSRENAILQKKIFLLHGVTKEQFYNSFDYYAKHPALMTTILDSIVAKENRNRYKPEIKVTKDYE